MFLTYGNQSIDSPNKLTDWFLYDENIGGLDYIFCAIANKHK